MGHVMATLWHDVKSSASNSRSESPQARFNQSPHMDSRLCYGCMKARSPMEVL
jgi:hypothetical protein